MAGRGIRQDVAEEEGADASRAFGCESLVRLLEQAVAARARAEDYARTRAETAVQVQSGVMHGLQRGNDGELDRHGLKQMLLLRAFRRDSTGVLIGPVSVERRGDRLVATFILTLTGGKPDSLLPDRADVFAMTTAWTRENGRWRCYSADWKQKF